MQTIRKKLANQFKLRRILPKFVRAKFGYIYYSQSNLNSARVAEYEERWSKRVPKTLFFKNSINFFAKINYLRN